MLCAIPTHSTPRWNAPFGISRGRRHAVVIVTYKLIDTLIEAFISVDGHSHNAYSFSAYITCGIDTMEMARELDGKAVEPMAQLHLAAFHVWFGR